MKKSILLMATLVAVTLIPWELNSAVEITTMDVQSVPTTQEGIAQLQKFLDNSAAKVKEAINAAKTDKMLSDIQETIIQNEAALRAQITMRLNKIAQQKADLAASAKAVLDKAKDVEQDVKNKIQDLAKKVAADQKDLINELAAQAEANKQQIINAANAIVQVTKAQVNQAKKQVQGLAKQFKL